MKLIRFFPSLGFTFRPGGLIYSADVCANKQTDVEIGRTCKELLLGFLPETPFSFSDKADRSCACWSWVTLGLTEGGNGDFVLEVRGQR